MTPALAGEILGRTTFWVCLLYPVASLWWPWWQSAIGVTVMAEACGFALLLLPAQFHYWFGWETATVPAWEWFSLACFAGFPITLIWRAWAIWAAQKRGARDS